MLHIVVIVGSLRQQQCAVLAHGIKVVGVITGGVFRLQDAVTGGIRLVNAGVAALGVHHAHKAALAVKAELSPAVKGRPLSCQPGVAGRIGSENVRIDVKSAHIPRHVKQREHIAGDGVAEGLLTAALPQQEHAALQPPMAAAAIHRGAA